MHHKTILPFFLLPSSTYIVTKYILFLYPLAKLHGGRHATFLFRALLYFTITTRNISLRTIIAWIQVCSDEQMSVLQCCYEFFLYIVIFRGILSLSWKIIIREGYLVLIYLKDQLIHDLNFIHCKYKRFVIPRNIS